MLSTREAAAQVGMTKAGIIKAIHKGKLSATRNDNDEFVIDPAELFRVYEPAPTNGNSDPKVDDDAEDSAEEGYRQQLTLLERIIRDKEAVIADARETISDLRGRLDQSTAQVSQLSAVIAQLQPAKAKVGWWQRLLGGGSNMTTPTTSPS